MRTRTHHSLWRERRNTEAILGEGKLVWGGSLPGRRARIAREGARSRRDPRAANPLLGIGSGPGCGLTPSGGKTLPTPKAPALTGSRQLPHWGRIPGSRSLLAADFGIFAPLPGNKAFFFFWRTLEEPSADVPSARLVLNALGHRSQVLRQFPDSRARNVNLSFFSRAKDASASFPSLHGRHNGGVE